MMGFFNVDNEVFPKNILLTDNYGMNFISMINDFNPCR